MRSSTFHLFALPILLRSHAFLASAKTPAIHDDDDGLFYFHSRPDIRAPKWNVTVYDSAALAPGYWFFGPYETLNMDDSLGNGWIGPHIYAQDGTLVWSGAPLFENGNIEDFRISNVNGENIMTVMDQRHARGVFIDNHYQVRDRREANGPEKHTFNSHEFHFVENGTKALVVWSKNKDIPRDETMDQIGLDDKCTVACDGIHEYDVASWQSSWVWSSCGHIGLEESTYKTDAYEKQCRGRWDYVHANSIDKTNEGDYILSSRHTSTIYKISKDDGHIIWRLGGVMNDFNKKDDFIFSRQHDIRYRGGNSTHMQLSMLDNAKGLDNNDPTHPFSRGLLISVDEENMNAQIIAHYDHPDGDGSLAFRRGNYQPLPNGNVFMCWSERAHQSEHAEDGTMLMQARLNVDWLGTYRAYKFEHVGTPVDPPDVVGEVKATDDNVKTVVHVSWNGATEVHSWNLYHTTKRGTPRILVNSKTKSGFETKLTYKGYASYVIAEAVAKNGTALGESKVVDIVAPPRLSNPAIDEELEWQNNPPESNGSWFEVPLVAAGAMGLAACVALLCLFAIFRRLRRRTGAAVGGKSRRSFFDILSRGRYSRLGDQEKELQDRETLMNGHRRRDNDDAFADHEEFSLGEESDEDDDVGRKEGPGTEDFRRR